MDLSCEAEGEVGWHPESQVFRLSSMAASLFCYRGGAVLLIRGNRGSHWYRLGTLSDPFGAHSYHFGDLKDDDGSHLR